MYVSNTLPSDNQKQK